MGDTMGSPEFRPGQIENKGSTTLGMATRDTTLPGRRPPEAPPIGEEPKPKKQKGGGIRKAVGRSLIAGAAVVALGGAVYETYENSPQFQQAIHRTVPGLGGDEAPSGVDNNTTNTEKVQLTFNNSADDNEGPSVFDNEPSEGTISGNNTITVSNLDSLQGINAVPQSSGDGHTINILVPIKDIPPSGKVDYKRDLIGKNPSNSIYAPESRQYAMENSIENQIVLKGIPAGSTILAPIDGEFMYNRIRNSIPEGALDGATFFFKDEKGILYQISINDDDLKPLAPVLDVPFRTMKDARDDFRKFVHPIKKGQPILKSLQQGDILIYAHAWPSGQFGIEESVNGERLYPVNISFLIHEQKLVFLEK